MEHAMEHTLLGYCWWDLPALIILIAVIVVLVVRHRKLKKREQELEDAISEKYTDHSVMEEEIKF
ncbi:MAG: hypothetical protein MJ161_06035 [Clostridia bacterium]|nr:hypothetical protein [Clostridia bacterium]